MGKVKLKVIIDLYGSLIQSIQLELNDIIELEVVVLENAKYADCGREEVVVEEGTHKGSIIYCCHDSIPATPTDIRTVFEAAKKYKEQK